MSAVPQNTTPWRGRLSYYVPSLTHTPNAVLQALLHNHAFTGDASPPLLTAQGPPASGDALDLFFRAPV